MTLIAEQELRRLDQLGFEWSGPALVPGLGNPASVGGGGGLFRELRPFVAGADARRIDWRASARNRMPMVRGCDDEAASEWFICLDNSASMAAPDPARWRLAREMAVAVAYLLCSYGEGAGLLAFGDSGLKVRGAVRGRHGFLTLASAIETLRCEPPHQTAGAARWSKAAASMASLRTRVGLVVLSDCLAPDGMTRLLGNLAQSGHLLRLVTITSTMDVPDVAEGAVLRDVETGQVLRPAPGARHHAGQQLAALRRRLAGFCGDAGIELTFVAADSSWLEALAATMRKRVRV